MSGQGLIKKNYGTWDEAFRGLIPEIRQQSVRVASYSKVIYQQACASSYGKGKTEYEKQMTEDYADLAYKCGLYHQLGKSYLPANMQLLRKDFTDSDKVLYHKYPAEGRYLVSVLQEKTSRLFIRRPKTSGEIPTDNITWLMVRESCEQHMERWNGSGYPAGRVSDEISPIAQIVGLAKELDRLVSETKSENPFEEAFTILMNEAGKGFSEELIDILKACRGKCRAIYRKYIQYTKTLPKTISLVEKRKERPMGLEYRLIGPDMYEAVPWFAGVLNEPEKKEDFEKLLPMLVRTKTLNDIMYYFIYETCDTLLRLQNCELDHNGILVPLQMEFYKGESQLAKIEQILEDQPIDMSKLLFSVPLEAVVLADPMEKENFISYIEAGLQLVLDNYRPELLMIENIAEYGFSKIRIKKDMEQEAKLDLIEKLQLRGLTIIEHGTPGADITEEMMIQQKLIGERE